MKKKVLLCFSELTSYLSQNYKIIFHGKKVFRKTDYIKNLIYMQILSIQSTNTLIRVR